MEFTQEHEGIRRGVKKFIDAEINPHVDAWEEAGIFPAHELFKKMGDQGYLGINKPVKYGGMGLDYSYQLVFLETLGHIRAAACRWRSACRPTWRRRRSPASARRSCARSSSSPRSRATMSPASAYPRSAPAPTSPPSRPPPGRTAATTSSTAARCGPPAARKPTGCACLANTGDGPVHKNKSLICLPMKTKGVQIARKLDKLGMRSSDTAQIFFEDVRVPQRYRIGKEGEGFTYQMQQFQEERLYAAAAGLIAKERMIEETIAYTGQRKAFGQSILDNQVVHFRLAELKTEVEMLRALTYRAAELMLKGEDVTMLASMAKLKSGRLSREISDACLQYWGGMGFMNETSISRAYRDTRLGSIGGGADEIMLSIICKHMGILPGKRNK